MANLKPKTPRLISINGETDTGGAPIFADDLVRIQENERANTLNYFEALRRLLPELPTWNGAALVKQFENGLILSGLEYDNTDPANPVVSEGYILSGGEVCYYPGGTIATGGVNRGLLYLYKGAAVNTARTFNVGGSKDILVTYDVVVETANTSVNGVELPGATGITATDEVVVLGIGVAGPFLGEDYFTARTAQGVTGLASQVSENPWVAATPFGANTVGATLPYIVSRVNADGTTEIRGSINVDSTSQVGANIIVASLGAHNINSGSSIPLNAHSSDSSDELLRSIVNLNGDIRIEQPAGGWPGVDFDLVINTSVLGDTTLPTPYNYVNAFLDIT